MNRRYNTLQSARSRSEQHALTPWGSALLLKSTRLADGFQVDVSSDPLAAAVKVTDLRRYNVDLNARTCDCRRFDIPCAHACLGHLGGASKDYVGVFYSQERWNDTYSVNLKPLDTEGIIRLKRGYDTLAVAELEQKRVALPTTPLGHIVETPKEQPQPVVPGTLKPLCTVVPRGHPTKRRERKGDLSSATQGPSPDGRAKPCCSICKMPGHYVRSQVHSEAHLE